MSGSKTVEPNGLLLALETSTLAGSFALARNAEVLHACKLPAELRRTGRLMPEIQAALERAGSRLRDVQAVAWSAGPGSFTGLRTAATIARVLASSIHATVISVPSLAVVAANVIRLLDAGGGAAAIGRRIAAVRDARRGQVFAVIYRVESFASTRDQHGAAAETRAPSAVAAPALSSDIEIPVADGLALVSCGPPRSVDPATWLGQIEPPDVVTGDGLETAAHRAAFEARGVRVVDPALWAPDASILARLGVALWKEGGATPKSKVVPIYVRPPECEEVYEARRAAARAKRARSSES